jgi:hypothetical protein
MHAECIGVRRHTLERWLESNRLALAQPPGHWVNGKVLQPQAVEHHLLLD